MSNLLISLKNYSCSHMCAYTPVYVCAHLVCVHMTLKSNTCGGQRTTCGNCLSPAMWYPGAKLVNFQIQFLHLLSHSLTLTVF